ncbi:MAG: hypothetical protein HQ521_16910 [Bacteroidetes bacterium]|nr:hypothetical protein [Bacteroidota bacterium]
MIKKTSIIAIHALVLFIVLPFVVNAGWVITEESTDVHGNRMIQTTFIQNNFIRHETQSSIAIIDFKKKIITLVFSQYKVYWSGTIQQLKENSISAYDKQMEEMLIGLSPVDRIELDSIYNEIRAQLLDTNRVVNNNIAVFETSENEKILEYNARKYNIKLDTIIIESVWHTTEVKPYNHVDVNYMISFMKQLNPISGQGSISYTDEYIELLKSGMLLKSIEYLPDSNQQIIRVTNIREINIIDDFFIPPPNYREASFSDILYLMPLLEEEGKDYGW